MTTDRPAGSRAGVHHVPDPIPPSARTRQILTTVRTMFAEEGTDAPMEEIARRSGVGVGTLYRRFPDRKTLIWAVTQDSLDLVLAEARAAVTEERLAWDALARLVTRSFTELKLTFRLAIFSAAAGESIREVAEIQTRRDEFMGLLDTLVHTAQGEGSMRADVDTGDVAQMFALLLGGIQATVDETADLAAERALALVLDSLRAERGVVPLPGRPMTAKDLDSA